MKMDLLLITYLVKILRINIIRYVVLTTLPHHQPSVQPARIRSLHRAERGNIENKSNITTLMTVSILIDAEQYHKCKMLIHMIGTIIEEGAHITYNYT